MHCIHMECLSGNKRHILLGGSSFCFDSFVPDLFCLDKITYILESCRYHSVGYITCKDMNFSHMKCFDENRSESTKWVIDRCLVFCKIYHHTSEFWRKHPNNHITLFSGIPTSIVIDILTSKSNADI